MKPAFGIFDYTMAGKIRRLLKPFGLSLKVRTNRREWGDQVEVTVERPASTQRIEMLGTLHTYGPGSNTHAGVLEVSNLSEQLRWADFRFGDDVRVTVELVKRLPKP